LPGLDGGLPKKKCAVKLHGVVEEKLSKSKATAVKVTAAKMKAASTAGHSEGIDHLLATMAENLPSAKFQGEACRRLVNMAMDDNVGWLQQRSQVRCEAIATAGGIERILAAMAKHPKVEDVLFHAVAALDILADDCDFQAKIVQLGGVERVLAAMEASGLLSPVASSVLIKIAFNVKPVHNERVYLDCKTAIIHECHGDNFDKNGKVQLRPDRTSKAHLKEHVMAAISARFASSKIPMSDDIKGTKLEDGKKTTAKLTHKQSLKKTTSDLKNYPGTFFMCTKCFEIISKDDWDEENPSGSPHCSYHTID